jgi:hypothetical protein
MNCALCRVEIYQTAQGWFHNTSLRINHEALTAITAKAPLRSRHDVAKRRTAAWEARQMARKFFPWRLAR